MFQARVHTGQRGRPGTRLLDDGHGFTLVEVTIILTVLSVLSLVLLPSMGGYLRDARLARARSDVGVIHDGILRFLADTREGAFRSVGNGGRETMGEGTHAPASLDPDRIVRILVSDGEVPDDGGVDESWRWRKAANGEDVDSLANHLIENAPGGDRANRYRTPEDLDNSDPSIFAFASRAGFNARFAWRGPYLSGPVRSDPWGNRYAVNVLFLDPVADSADPFEGHSYDVFVLSAGPDEEIDTPWAVDGVVPGDDDVIRVIAGEGR